MSIKGKLFLNFSDKLHEGVLVNRVFSLLIVIFGYQSVFAAWGQESIAQQKTRAIKKLSARKKSFDQFHARKSKWQQQRLARAGEMKGIRKKHADRKERARRGFVRTTNVFPKKAYRKFLANRKVRRAELEVGRQQYGKMRKQLDTIYKNKKYNIDGKKEFELDRIGSK